MDALLDSLQTLLKPEVLTALAATPFVLQWAKKLPWFNGQWAALLAPIISTLLILTQAWGICSWSCMVFQCVVGWLVVELVYTRVVEPMANSSNPLVPKA